MVGKTIFSFYLQVICWGTTLKKKSFGPKRQNGGSFHSFQVTFIFFFFLLAGLALRRSLTSRTTCWKRLEGSWYNNSWWGHLCEKVEDRRYLCPARAVQYVDDATIKSSTMSQQTPTETCGYRHLDLDLKQWEVPLYTHLCCACSGLSDKLSPSALLPYREQTNIGEQKTSTSRKRSTHFRESRHTGGNYHQSWRAWAQIQS